MACDKLVVTPGAMLGSIGVIMQFANLEDLYGWAKIKKYSIQSGKFKDSGAEHRPMREDERLLFQDMIDEVYTQFKKTVAEGRNLDEKYVAEYADGRVMTGAKAVELKFADQVGTFQDAVEVAASAAGLKEGDYQLFHPRRDPGPWYQEIFDQENSEDDLNSAISRLFKTNAMNSTVVDQLNESADGRVSSAVGQGVSAGLKNLLKLNLLNQPLYLMPGHWE
jgi:protease-4